MTPNQQRFCRILVREVFILLGAVAILACFVAASLI